MPVRRHLRARPDPAEFPGAEQFLPHAHTLQALNTAVQGCRGCPLYRRATQAVFGEGLATSRIMLIGEQPGDAEDRRGRPFVGPSGRLLDEALARAGIPRDEVYVTNAVKHFKYTMRGKRRIHDKPSRYETTACQPWLGEELAIVEPEVIVLLGATAAQALLGTDFRVSMSRGIDLANELAEARALAPHVFATVHPGAVLRAVDKAAREKSRAAFFADLARVGDVFRGL
ncbi:MAG: UdgX family uracil-DNA binding protein [Deltaproteobacteria bacterium]|nr:UdgX family uracil-DNA binding protein [Deltaproteobacteria bacterium]MCW5808001.1 UdgX family uracil-DNA binding protein [Deltaproteobacteria bacterium]